jgi:hypothetical protein
MKVKKGEKGTYSVMDVFAALCPAQRIKYLYLTLL